MTFDMWFSQYAPTAPECLDDCARDAWNAAIFAERNATNAVMTDAEILGVAHRMAWRYKKSSDPHHSDTYTFNATTMVDFARRVMAAAASEENREYYCTKHAPDGFFQANEPPWPFWKCVTCGYPADGWVVALPPPSARHSALDVEFVCLTNIALAAEALRAHIVYHGEANTKDAVFVDFNEAVLAWSPNAKVSGAGTASAGLTGCAANGTNNERNEK